jgi:hypothetical protein
MAQWLLTLDVSYSFAVDPGFQRDPHHREFRPEKDSFNNTYLEPATNLLMLRPSFMKRKFDEDFKPLTQWRTKEGWWQPSYRGQDKDAATANMFTAVKPADQGFELIELLVDVAIVAIEASIAHYDDMKWVAESEFTLDVDEGFVIHYHTLGDEFRRKRNWFAVMWDDILLHFSFDGRVRVYQYDREDLTQQPVLVEEFVIASPGELLNKSGYFVFLPIPGYGLSVSHSRVPQKNIFSPSNVRSGVTRAHLVEWRKRTIGGYDRLFEASAVRIAHNPYIPPVIGFQNITYTAGDYTDAIFDPGFKPSVMPSQLDTFLLTTGYGGASTELRKADNSGVWGIGDQQGRVKVSMTPDASGKHTPFVMFWDIAWDPVFATRLTTPLELARYAEDGTDRLMRLEWGDDDMGRFEGKVKAMLSTTAGRKIALRGDATFRLDWRNDDTENWQILFGGFAQEWTVTLRHDTNFGTWFECDFVLKGMEQRFRETHRLFESAFDGNSVGGAINQTLRGSSLPPLSSVPTEAATKTIPRPPDGKAWRFAPKEGDESEEILRILLLFLHTQGVEWRMPFNWANNTFTLEKKPRYDGADGWALVAYDELSNAGAHIWAYGEDPNIRPEPPEANILILEGLTDPSPDGKRVMAKSINKASINDPNSEDYLGRALVAKVKMHGIADKGELNIMARRLMDAISHRRLPETIPIRHLQMGLGPNIQITQYDGEGRVVLTGYIKHRTVVVEEEGNEEMFLDVDSVWEGPWK